MKNIAIVALVAAMSAIGAIVVACGGGTPPAQGPDNVPSASGAPEAPATGSAAPATSGK
jgi:hypothetical protein